MAIRFYFLFFFCFVSFHAFSQEKSLKINLHFTCDKFYLLDPLQFEFSVENIGGISEIILPISLLDNKLMYGVADIEYRIHNSMEWNHYCKIRSFGFESAGYISEKSIEIFPKEEKRSGIMNVLPALKTDQQNENDIWATGSVIILKPGKYDFRIRYSMYLPSLKGRWDTLLSQPVTISINNYETIEDQKSFQFLSHIPKPNFLVVYQLKEPIAGFKQDLEPYAQELIRRFPKSRFAPWAYIFLADVNRLYIREIKSEGDKQHNLTILRKIKTFCQKSREYNIPVVTNYSQNSYYVIYQYLTEILGFDENEMKTNPIAKEFAEQ